MSDELAGLTALLSVAEKRSFTAAAAELRVTPSAVSQTIRGLEERVGVRLLQRTTRSVGLTEAGARFIARLKPAMEGVREAFESIGELRDRPAGLLRLTLPRLGYELVLAPKLSAFLAAYPDINLDVSIDEALSDIVEQGFDAGIRIGEMVERDMIGVRVTGDLRMAVVGAPSYFAARRKPKHPRDLHAHDCINYRQRTLGVVYRWEFTEDGKDFEIAVNGRMLLNDGALMLDAALDGLGLAYVLESGVREHLAAKRVVRVLDAFCVPFPGLFLYYPSRAHIAPKLQALVEFLKVGRPRSKRR
ncbi:MAG: Transcriptional regulator, LysR family protein [Myxococcales bacterium]|nr:Transcriptional regulator, LysR family protein [Myxococcales bacterium]